MSARAERPTARILLTDRAGRLLLFRFDPPDRPPFWCTPGGALDPGETYAEAARRELREETGIDAPIGPEVARRVVEFTTLEGAAVAADERYFPARADRTEVTIAGHTDLERQVMRSWRWFSREDLASHDEQIFPENLIELLGRSEAAA